VRGERGVIHLKGENCFNESGTEAFEGELSEIKELVSELRSRLGTKFSFSKAVGVLLEYPCLRRCVWELTRKREDSNIDPFYLVRHEFVKNRFIELLRLELSKHKLNLRVVSEDPGELGKADVAIKNINNGFRIVSGSVIRVEVKAGASLDINQIIRYLIDSDSVILLRVLSEDAVILRRKELSPIIKNTLTILRGKLTDILNALDKQLPIIPGKYCRSCKASCDYASNTDKNGVNNYANLEKDLKNTLIKTDEAIKKAIKLVLTELLNNMGEGER